MSEPELVRLLDSAHSGETPHGILADWLEEHGHAEAAILARFGSPTLAVEVYYTDNPAEAGGRFAYLGYPYSQERAEFWRSVGAFLIGAGADPATMNFEDCPAPSANSAHRGRVVARKAIEDKVIILFRRSDK